MANNPPNQWGNPIPGGSNIYQNPQAPVQGGPQITTMPNSGPFDVGTVPTGYYNQSPINYSAIPGSPVYNPNYTGTISPYQQQAIGSATQSQAGSSGAPLLGVAEMGFAALQYRKASKELERLAKIAQPTYTPTTQMRESFSRAQTMAQRGFTPEEEAAFRQNLSTASNTAFQRGIDMAGGNMARALSVGIGTTNAAAISDFAARDAAMKRANIQYADRLGQEMSNLEIQNQSLAIQRDAIMRQSWANLQQQALKNAFTGARNVETGINQQRAAIGQLAMGGLS